GLGTRRTPGRAARRRPASRDIARARRAGNGDAGAERSLGDRPAARRAQPGGPLSRADGRNGARTRHNLAGGSGMNLIVVEMRRALHRRVVRVLIVLALLACTAAGIIVFVDSAGKTLAELQVGSEQHPALMRNWWIAGTGDGALMISLFFLLLGGLFGGASVTGAEWRAGTVTTLLTWEPRRARVHLSRTAACAILAALISFALQAVFLASLLPAVIANGSSAGTDAGWWGSLIV